MIGREPLLSLIERDLDNAQIEVGERIVLPGEGTVSKGVLNELTKGKGGLIVVATPDVTKLFVTW